MRLFVGYLCLFGVVINLPGLFLGLNAPIDHLVMAANAYFAYDNLWVNRDAQ